MAKLNCGIYGTSFRWRRRCISVKRRSGSGWPSRRSASRSGGWEGLVGHRLFDRTTRGVKLTLAGQSLAERARSTMEKIQDDLAQVRRLGRGEEGTLTLGFAGSAIFTGLPAAIGNYRRRYPKVELRLRELSTSAQIAALLDGTLDLAFLRDGEPTDGVQMTSLLKEPYVAVLPDAHTLARKRALHVRDLREEPFIWFVRRMGPLAFDRTVRCCERNGFRPRIVQDARQWPTLVRLVAAGLGGNAGSGVRGAGGRAGSRLPGCPRRMPDHHRFGNEGRKREGPGGQIFIQIAREHLCR